MIDQSSQDQNRPAVVGQSRDRALNQSVPFFVFENPPHGMGRDVEDFWFVVRTYHMDFWGHGSAGRVQGGLVDSVDRPAQGQVHPGM